MNLNDIGLIAMLGRRMSWLGRNHDVLAQNIANANTPGYKARALKPRPFRTMVAEAGGPIALTLTAAGHMPGMQAPARDGVRPQRDPYEVTITGNSVSIEQQAVKIGRNAMDYQLATTLYGKAVDMLRVVSGNRR
jgi:flagellar basal-body rod protein FlgB